jgi:hypothetical protein
MPRWRLTRALGFSRGSPDRIQRPVREPSGLSRTVCLCWRSLDRSIARSLARSLSARLGDSLATTALNSASRARLVGGLAALLPLDERRPVRSFLRSLPRSAVRPPVRRGHIGPLPPAPLPPARSLALPPSHEPSHGLGSAPGGLARAGAALTTAMPGPTPRPAAPAPAPAPPRRADRTRLPGPFPPHQPRPDPAPVPPAPRPDKEEGPFRPYARPRIRVAASRDARREDARGEGG